MVSISDTNSGLAKSLATKYNVNAYTDFRRMLEEKKIDAVSICVPTCLHYEIAMECVDRGISVLLEKPITDNIDQASNLLEFSRKKNVRLLVGHIERFNPMVRRVKEIIGVGQIGKVIAIIARRVGRIPPQIIDADVATDLAIHDIDICNYLLEDLPARVTKNGQRSLSKNRDDSVEFFLKYGSRKIRLDPYLAAFFRPLADGVVFFASSQASKHIPDLPRFYF